MLSDLTTGPAAGLDEAKQKTSKEAEIERLKAEVQLQLQKRSEMEAEVKKMSKYQAFLDMVLEIEEDYPEIADLLSRYATLDAANKDLIERQDTAGRENEEERHKLQMFVREKTDEILAINNQIAELQQQEESEQAAARDLVAESDRQMTTVAESTLDLGQVQSSTTLDLETSTAVKQQMPLLANVEAASAPSCQRCTLADDLARESSSAEASSGM